MADDTESPADPPLPLNYAVSARRRLVIPAGFIILGCAGTLSGVGALVGAGLSDLWPQYQYVAVLTFDGGPTAPPPPTADEVREPGFVRSALAVAASPGITQAAPTDLGKVDLRFIGNTRSMAFRYTDADPNRAGIVGPALVREINSRHPDLAHVTLYGITRVHDGRIGTGAGYGMVLGFLLSAGLLPSRRNRLRGDDTARGEGLPEKPPEPTLFDGM